MRTLVAIPTYNEAPTIGGVVAGVRCELPQADVLVIDDGSQDDGAARSREAGATVAWHRCNLGYGRAVQTALRYAERYGYDRMVTLDADGQHRPADLPRLLDAFDDADVDLLIGSRYTMRRCYDGTPVQRRVGMQIFSWLTLAVGGQRIYDTTSGMKVFSRVVYRPLTRWHFVDFHAEALIYLMRLGYRVGEYPITVEPRTHGSSMYSALSSLKYPAKTALMIVLALVQAHLSEADRP